MKLVILAGGYGTRIGERTTTLPKPMIPVGDRPILWHIMKYFSCFGINEFVVCLGYLGEVIKDFFVNFQTKGTDLTVDLASAEIEFHNPCREDWKVTLAETGMDTLKGGRIKRIAKYLDDETNLLTYGDGLSDINISDLVEFHKSHNKLLTISGVHPPARFGEIGSENGRLTFSEKPQVSQGQINGGFMVFNKKMMDYLSEDEGCDFEAGPLEKLAGNNKVMVFEHKGNWACMDHERDVVYLNRLWTQQNAFWKIW